MELSCKQVVSRFFRFPVFVLFCKGGATFSLIMRDQNKCRDTDGPAYRKKPEQAHARAHKKTDGVQKRDLGIRVLDTYIAGPVKQQTVAPSRGYWNFFNLALRLLTTGTSPSTRLSSLCALVMRLMTGRFMWQPGSDCTEGVLPRLLEEA